MNNGELDQTGHSKEVDPDAIDRYLEKEKLTALIKAAEDYMDAVSRVIDWPFSKIYSERCAVKQSALQAAIKATK